MDVNKPGVHNFSTHNPATHGFGNKVDSFVDDMTKSLKLNSLIKPEHEIFMFDFHLNCPNNCQFTFNLLLHPFVILLS